MTENVRIRSARPEDGRAVGKLLDELGYPNTQAFIAAQIRKFAHRKNSRILVAECGKKVIGVLALYFIPQLALAGDFARITYFIVSSEHCRSGIGRKLIDAAEALAYKRNCDRIEVHCHVRRTEAHQFYIRRQYEESPKYLIKMLPRTPSDIHLADFC
jgi:GNAT superfamily N-acetyltransferase